MALGENQETLQSMTGEWLTQYTEEDFMEYQVEDKTLDIYLYWPGCDKLIPRPLDLLLIFVSDNNQIPALRETYENFKNVVFKVVVGHSEPDGLTFAGEINSKWTQVGRDQNEFLEKIVSLNEELDELMKKTFDSIDTDNSGFIDMDELSNLSKALGHDLTPQELDIVFEELDENKDRKISFAEFTTWWKRGRRGKGNMMKKMVGYQTQAKRFLEGAHSEIAAVSTVESVADDELTKFSLDIKIGDEISDSKLGIWAKANSGDVSERDEIAAKGGLDDTEKNFFMRFSFKIAEGKDEENARDRLSSLVTKIVAFTSSQDRHMERTFSIMDWKYRVNDGHVDMYVIVNQDATIIKRFEEEGWPNIGGFFNANVQQEISGSLTFAKALGDIRDAGERPPLEPLFEGMNLNVKADVWQKLQDIFIKLIEAADANDVGMFFPPLISGGSLDLKFGSINDIPEEIRTMMRGMSPVPTAEVLFGSILPAMRDESLERSPPILKQMVHTFMDYFDGDSLKAFFGYKHLSKSVRVSAGGLSRFMA